jgi:hypothetical protein
MRLSNMTAVGPIRSDLTRPMTWLRRAADRAAKEQVVPGDATGISYEDKDGRWHDEVSPGSDRPETDVEG